MSGSNHSELLLGNIATMCFPQPQELFKLEQSTIEWTQVVELFILALIT
jgi:hypothetical protein